MRSKANRRFRSPALQYTYDRYIGTNPRLAAEYEQELLNAEIARKVYDLRAELGLSQQELAKHLGITAEAIRSLEDADYDGPVLPLLQRIAEGFGKRVEIRFAPAKKLRTARTFWEMQ